VGTLVCAVVAVVLGAAGPEPGEVRREVRRVLDDGAFQRELPIGEGEGPGRAGDPARRDLPPAAPRRDRLRRREARSGDVPGPLGSVAQLLLWALTAVGIGLVVFLIARELTGYAGDASASDDGEDGDALARDGPDRAVIERPLGDADELARRGQYGEAIHVLLLRTLQELARRLPERLPPSLTSREILGRVRMPDEARRALSVLVSAAEVSHFGGAAPGEADFAACRQHFQRFAEAYMRGQG